MPESDDARMRRLLAAQGVTPPVSDELAGSPANAEQADYARIEAAQARAQARDMADALSGGEDSRTAAARGLVQGFMGGVTGASTQGPSGASGSPPAPLATGPTPEPTPPVSDELEGTPAASDEARMRRLLAAQGQVPPATPPAPPQQTPAAEPPEIEITDQDIADYERTHGGTPAQAPAAQASPQMPQDLGPPADPNSPLPSVRERAAAQAAAGAQPQQQPSAPGPQQPQAPVADAISGAAPIVRPPEEPMSRLDILQPRALRPDTRAKLERQLADIPSHSADYDTPEDMRDAQREVQQALDMDTTKWSVSRSLPPGLLPVTQDPDDPKSPPVPGQYVDANGETVWRTGDPQRDARIKRFTDADSEERQLAHRDAREKEASPLRQVPPQERRRLGLDQEGALNGNPDDVDSLTRKYILQNEPDLPGGFSDNLGLVDAQGRPTPPTEEDIAYRQGNMLDQSYKDSIEALARQRAVEELRQRQQLPLRQKYDETSERIAQARINALQEFTRLHRQYWDEARSAQRAADARYPNPDQLLGGKGSWSRAVALGIAAAGGSVGMSGAAAVVNNAMNMEWAGRSAAYRRERQRMADAAMNADQSLATMNAVDAALVGQQAAAKQRLADQFDLIAAQTGDQALRAQYQGLAAKLKEEAAKTLGTFATQTANRDLKNAQLGLTAAQIEERRREFDLRHGIGVGGPSAITSEGYFLSDQLESLPKDKRERAVRIPGTKYAILTPNTQLSNELNKQLAGTRQTVDHIDAVLALLPNLPGWFDKVRAKAKLEPGDVMVFRNELQQAALSAKEAYKLGAISKSDADMLEALGADPNQVSSLNVTADKLQSVLTNWRRGMARDAQNTVEQFNTGKAQRTNFGNPPEEVRPEPASRYFARLNEVPVVDKTGAWMPDAKGNADHGRPFLSKDEVLGIVGSGIEAIDRDGTRWPDAKPQLAEARANLLAGERKVRGQWLLMVQDRAKLIKSGGTSGRDREAAIDRVKSSIDAYQAGVKRLDAEISKREAAFQRQLYLDRTRDERFIESLPH